MHRTRVKDAQNIMRIERTFVELEALCHFLTVGHADAGRRRQLIGTHVAGLRIYDINRLNGRALGFLDVDNTADFSQRCRLLGLARLKQLFNSRKTLRNIRTSNAAGMERTHGQLRTRLADGLRSNDTDRFALANQRTHCQVDAVAVCADTLTCTALEHRADLHTSDARRDDCVRIRVVHHLGLRHNHLAGLRVTDVINRETAKQTLMQRLNDLIAFLDILDPDALGRAAVIFADDDILRNVNQSTSQVTRVRSTQCSIGHALSRATRRNEVFEYGQALTEVRLDRDFDGFTGGGCHQAAHTGQLTNLVDRTTRTGIRHHVNRVVAIRFHISLQLGGYHLGGLFPLGYG